MQIPDNSVPCWYVKEDEKQHFVRSHDKNFPNNPCCFFFFLKRIDSFHIEGELGHVSNNGEVHKSLNPRYSYFRDYLDRQVIYFTFDKITLYKLVSTFPVRGSGIRIILKRLNPKNVTKKDQAFMIMPFGNKNLDTFYEENIRAFLKNKVGISVYRADDFNDNDIIIETIYRLIEESEFIIADTTHPNKNSFYELGYAAALSKEIITIQNKTEGQLFFDRTHIRSILYDLQEGTEFQENLKNTIQAIRGRH